LSTTHTLPALPEVGHPERYYVEGGHEADRCRDRHAHEAFKVGLYVTRAVNYLNTWEEKFRCFEHALKHHCHAPPSASPPTLEFYGQMAQMVREHAGAEALRTASKLDDRWAARIAAGEPRARVVQEARAFFKELLPTTHRPEWMNMGDYEQLRILRSQWG
jgi:hypothetical protein